VASTEKHSLSAEWRSIIYRISSVKALEDAQEFCRQMRNPIPRVDVRVDQEAVKQDRRSQTATPSDRRLTQLKVLISSADEKEKSIKTLGTAVQVLKRMHLVELAERYMEEVKAEDATPKQEWRPSVIDRFNTRAVRIRRSGRRGRQ
jgi:viroplasmin and RNaseH domain-containing protein